MTSNRRSGARGRRRSPKRRGLWLGHVLAGWSLVLMLGATLAVVLYGIHLDRVVRSKFEGQRWALPARVWARPLELYAGRRLSPDQFESELERLNYRAVESPRNPGQYQRLGDRFEVWTRPFRFWDGVEPEHHLNITFADGQVETLTDADGGADPALVRLDAMLIASIYPTHNEDRVLVRRQDLPELLVKTLMAVEDRNFQRHPGVDPKGILRAVVSNLQAGAVVEGASTLTQQLVKNFYLTADRTLERKIKEAYMAVLLELHYSKDEILEAYANEIYLGQDGSRAIHGFGLASQFFFNLPLDELDAPKVALLVGLIQAPSSLDPRRNPEAAKARRDLVLDLMVRDAVISPDEAERAKRAPLGIQDGGGRPAGHYPDFISLVRRQLQRDYRDEDLRSEGLNIFTTLDPVVQAAVERSLSKKLDELERQHRMKAGSLEAAAVVTSVAQGEVLAIAGGREPGYAGFNRALDSVRSIGSLVKPPIYLTALSQPERYTLTTSLSDTPVSLFDGNKRWEPKNYDRRVNGSVQLHSALARSLNLATVNLGLSIGVKNVVDTLYKMGAQRRIRVVPAVLLGAVSMSPLEVAQIYQTIAAGGYRAPLRAIREVVDAQGRPLNRYPLAIEAVVDPRAAYLTTWAMQRVVTHGTAKWLGDQLPKGMTMAGKTGTTDEKRDSWFAGFSGDKVAVVWVGRDDYKPMGLTGGAGALRVWGDFMLALDNEPLPETPPEGVVLVDACGHKNVPYIGNSAKGAARCGGGQGSEARGASSAGDERTTARDESVATEAPVRPPEPPPKPKRTENHFMSDFFDR
ncbi:penicillin-binding protein 1B [Thermochromatium tepidum]|uniref:Penicillin-binding protein 1B n=1 Tax=Thermochromatium tepidum ATCC 43061 TaxID=316276 RepID=A0A6I6E863_THETI|nr:penicillin-binding protein 1B [Thermochromatium tepidum]QGU32738.1 penicillin-binding protein 1B [Thermochromatium tepidum ATCC 43061]